MENDEVVIERVCGNIAERIRACRTRHVAEMLKERLCTELVNQCQSDIIQTLLRQHVDQLIRKTFDASGNNLTLRG